MSDQFPSAVELVAIDDVIPDPENARLHDARNLESIKRSLQEFGQRKPIVVDADGIVRAGNGTLEAAKQLGWTQIAITRTALKGVDAAAYAVIDNRAGDLSQFDLARLATLIPTIPANKLIGFNDKEIAEIMASLSQKDGATEPDDTPDAPSVPITQPGDLWILGDDPATAHRILCGDSRIKDHSAKLFEIGDPFMMVTDPPYGVSYDPGWRNERLKVQDRAEGLVRNDNIADWTDVWRSFPGRVAYVWHAALFAATAQASLEKAGFLIRSHIIWVKNNLTISRGHYHWKHEPAMQAERIEEQGDGELSQSFLLTSDQGGAAESPEGSAVVSDQSDLSCEGEAWYAARKGQSAKWVGGRKQTSVWEIDYRGQIKASHGTQKPVECMARAIRNHGSPGNIVYDPFLGTGTTTIAAEMTGRICVGCEIDPAYVDVAVKRWEEFTGKTAVRIPNAVIFDIGGESEDEPEEITELGTLEAGEDECQATTKTAE